jgi:hypothetical protein
MLNKYVKLDGGRVVRILDKVLSNGYDKYLCEIVGVREEEVGGFILILPEDIRGLAKEWVNEYRRKVRDELNKK